MKTPISKMPIHQSITQFNFNPFGGILNEDLEKIIVPKIDLEGIAIKINSSKSLAIEFIGEQGRGKTTHLFYLQKQMDQFPLFRLDAKSTLSNILINDSSTVFVDSIHHLNLVDRIKLFKAKQKVIYTTHWNRRFECIIASKDYHSIKLKGIDTNLLTEILNKRLNLAAKSALDEKEKFTNLEAKQLIKKFGDNYRGIINYLYMKYQCQKEY